MRLQWLIDNWADARRRLRQTPYHPGSIGYIFIANQVAYAEAVLAAEETKELSQDVNGNPMTGP